jgi:hypothetical protein
MKSSMPNGHEELSSKLTKYGKAELIQQLFLTESSVTKKYQTHGRLQTYYHFIKKVNSTISRITDQFLISQALPRYLKNA